MATAGPDGQGGPHVFVEDLEALELAADDEHHLARVIRLRDGDALTASDGSGGWRACVFRGAVLEAVGDLIVCEAPVPRIGVGFALIKGGRPELVVQKLTELGVDYLVPIVCDRSVVRWDDAKAKRNGLRLAKVAREAAMQSRQVRVPEVLPLEPFGVAAARPGATLCERDGAAPSLERPFALVGPEGGWSDTERGVGLAHTSLGDSVLRAETAAIAVATLLSAVRSSLWG